MAVDEESPDKNVTKMSYTYNKALVGTAQKLRKQMTDEEKHLWYDFLKKLPITVNRQKNIDNYIVDFFIASKKIVIEIDGMQHGMSEHAAADEKRDRTLAIRVITVLRYTNRNVNQKFDEVCQDIMSRLGIHESE